MKENINSGVGYKAIICVEQLELRLNSISIKAHRTITLKIF